MTHLSRFSAPQEPPPPAKLLGPSPPCQESVAIRNRLLATICGSALLLGLTGCTMVGLYQELSEAKGLGLVTGPVTTPSGSTEDVYVALFRQTGDGTELAHVDHLTAVIGEYIFILEAGTPYFLVAFQDRDGDRQPDRGEPVAIHGRPRGIVVEPRQQLEGLELRLLEKTLFPTDLGVDFASLELKDFDSIPIAGGEVTTLDDERFTALQAKAGMWSPLSAVREVGGGVYFLEPYDPARIPVLFVHGIGGSPQDFRFLIERLDRDRYQPWLYHYPSGIRLPHAASLLARLVGSLHRELSFERIFVTAHSMGGLVARSALLQIEEPAQPSIELLVTFSTPWDGHQGAKQGVRYAPAVVPSWIDMQPGSDFLASLRAALPPVLPHHLFFGFETKKNPLMLYSHDTVVAVASQLAPWVQERAERLYGYDLDHVGILNDGAVAEAYRRILDQAAE